MSTSVKDLKYYQILFKRPAVALGVFFILGIIAVKPSYNMLAVLLAIPLYMILYQCRYYIYRLGMGRFDFLTVLIYAPLLLSAFFDWEYKEGAASAWMFGEFGLWSAWDLITNKPYQTKLFGWIWQNLDQLIHWKMIVFTPAIAGILYLIFVEFDRKSVKQTDVHQLELTDADLYKHGSGLVIGAIILLFLVSFIYGIPVFVAAMAIFMGLLLLPARVYVWVASLVSMGILLWNYASFDYVTVLSLPTRFTHSVHETGVLKTFVKITNVLWVSNIGQAYILLPYLFLTSMIALVKVRHKVKVEAIAVEEAKQEEVRTTADAIEFGVEISSGKPIRLTHKELNTHMYINGASGSGKTVAMLNFVIDAAEKGLPLIYIDGKGATDLVTKMAKIAARYKRVFKVFTLSPRDVESVNSYDFLGAGTFTEKKNRIMQLFIAAEQAGAAFYQDNLETFINRVFMLAEHQKLNIDLFRFLGLISNINDLVDMAKEDIILADGSKINLQSYFEEIRDMKQENSPRTRIITKLDPFIHSSYGYLFNVIGKDNVIRLKESIRNGEIVLFLFNASSFALDTERVAKMVISDINATFSEFGAEKTWIKTFCCFDEFKSYETDAIASTIALHRSNGMHAVIGTQSLSLIDRNIGNAILTNCQTHFIMNSASDDAARFADEFGTANKIESTTRIKADVQEVQDITTKRVRDLVIDKQDIKDIIVQTGHGYLHRKALGMKPVKIQVTQKI